MRRLLVPAFLVVASLLLAGCTSEGAIQNASNAELASRADAMLASPPGSDVKPTGRVKEFDLYLHVMTDHEVFPGAGPMTMWAFSLSSDPKTATLPGPILRVTAGDKVVVNFHPLTAGFNHTLHWHGQHVPYEMDGVPWMPQAPVEAGASFTYEFIAKPAGTYWYHCHVDAEHHVDMGMYGALIVDPPTEGEDPRFDKEFLLMLDDMDRFHVEGGQPTGQNGPTSGDAALWEEFLRRQASDAVNRNSQVSDRVTGTPLRPTRDWYPVTYAPYSADANTFLINGHAFPWTEPLVAAEGQVIRIRMINAGSTIFAMHLHGHHMLVTHKDGPLLPSPYWADTVALAPGERYDVYVKLDNPGIWDFHDHVGGHTQNDNIFPGGAMTMLAYEQFATNMTGHNHKAGQHYRHSGDYLRWTGHDLP